MGVTMGELNLFPAVTTPTDTMKNQASFRILLTLAGLGCLAGCATNPIAPTALESAKYTIESTEKLTLLDRTVQGTISCTGLQERVLPDGRLEVVAMVKNRQDETMKVQLNCVFKDAQGFSIGDETAFQTVALSAGATEAVRFTAATAGAKKFTVRVRQAR
jgi:uncharacterized protein YcfL